MPQQDTQDRSFTNLCSKYENYPKMEPEVQKPQDAFYDEQQLDKLHQRQELLFKDDAAELAFWETGDRNEFPEEHEEITVSDTEELRQHLDSRKEDPQIRHLFICSIDSRSPLKCSMDMFKLACCYHQVDTSFLESVHTFGKQSDPIDFCLAHFKASDNLGRIERDVKQLPELGRSGREIKLSYLLRSVEYSDRGPGGVWGWQIRQAANYHSFDVGTGRAFWLTVKGNELLQDRIQKYPTKIPSKPVVDEGDVSPYLKASLDTHVVYLSWCDEEWRKFINEVEAAIQKIVKPAIGALVDDHIDPTSDRVSSWPRSLQELRRSTMQCESQTWPNDQDNNAEKSGPNVLSRIFRRSSSALTLWSTREKNPNSDPEKASQMPEPSCNPSFISSNLDPHGTLDKFRFTDLQSLHLHADLIQRAILVIELNLGVLRDIRNYYAHLATTEFKGKDFCERAIEEFLSEVMSISRGLETRVKQLQCLQANLSQSMSLVSKYCIQYHKETMIANRNKYERVLQQRSNQISTMFAEIALENNRQMHQISDKTAKQTTSMHVITVATLLFLPATFVATFFQSGVLLWNEQEESSEGMTDPFKLKAASFMLFIELCVPLTIATVGGWLIVFLKNRKTAKGTLKAS